MCRGTDYLQMNFINKLVHEIRRRNPQRGVQLQQLHTSLTLLVFGGGGGKIGQTTQNLVKSARVRIIIALLNKTNTPV